ncbi:MAG: cytochrome c [Bacteroidetes bacterium]|nr:cytochrome c [Bacteroidota bacterium]
MNYPIDNEAVNGKLIWQKYNCNACHQIYGLGGYLGSDLTNEYSLKDTNFIKAFLMNGTDIMPNFNLTEQEVNALLAFLNTIDRSGKSDPRTFRINVNGTIKQ